VVALAGELGELLVQALESDEVPSGAVPSLVKQSAMRWVMQLSPSYSLASLREPERRGKCASIQEG
jgi:hypothetical protein